MEIPAQHVIDEMQGIQDGDQRKQSKQPAVRNRLRPHERLRFMNWDKNARAIDLLLWSSE
jgi:hypothetical protein